MANPVKKWQLGDIFKTVKISAFIMIVASVSLACSESSTESSVTVGAGTVVSAPLALSHRMINQDALILEYSVDGGELQLAPPANVGSGDRFITLSAAPGASFSIDFTWYIPHEGERLPLATYETGTLLVGSEQQQTINLDETLYVTTGEALDNDRDGASNLQELEEGFEPLNSNVCPSCRTDIDVVINTIRPTYGSPAIDGAYEEALWQDNAQFKSRQGRLDIKNLMIAGDDLDAEFGYRWAVMHDADFLYLMVFGDLEDKSRVNDSIEAVNDESIEVYIAPDPLSNNAVYDGDDYSFVIPLSGEGGIENRSGRRYSRIEKGPNSAMLELSDIEFATCHCSIGADVWELKIPLESVGVTVGEVFGIEIQVNLDEDGGLRDSKWGWSHPARTATDIDFTVRNPRVMGRVLLQ